jgi:NitT/TauT family transport system substrate-binding protein
MPRQRPEARGTDWVACTSACIIVLGLMVAAQWETPAAANNLDRVELGIARTMSDSGYYVADDLGYFRDESIQVTMTPFNSAAQMIAPLGTGELDVGGGTVSAAFYNAVTRGIRVKIVADQASMRPGFGYSSLLVRSDLVDSGRYKDFSDLKDMRVAIGAPGTGTAAALNEILKTVGLKYSDVTIINLGFPEHLSAYSNKAIDASITNEPTTTLAVEAGVAKRIVGNDQTYPNQQTAVVFYSENFIKERRDVALRFMRAYIRGVRSYMAALKGGKLNGPDADKIVAALAKHTAINDASLFRRIIPSTANPNGTVNMAGLRQDLAFFEEEGLIQKPDQLDLDSVVDDSFAKAAVDSLGASIGEIVGK